MSELVKFIKMEFVKNSSPESLVDLLDKQEKEITVLKEREKKLVEVLNDIAKTDLSDSVDHLWLSKWRNETKERAREVLKELGVTDV